MELAADLMGGSCGGGQVSFTGILGDTRNHFVNCLRCDSGTVVM